MPGTMFNLFKIITLFFAMNLLCEGSEESCEEKEKNLAIFDIAQDSFKKARDHYLNLAECDNSSSPSNQCEEREKLLFYLGSAVSLLSEIKDHVHKENGPSGSKAKPKIMHEKPMDCTQVMQNGNTVSGIYSIWPGTRIPDRPLDVYCDMETDGGGWTVIQRRGNFTPQEIFYRDWIWYKHGFGNLSKEFWIGNENLFILSNQALYRIRFDLGDVNKNKGFAVYQSFRIEGEASAYRLHIEDYNGTVGDSMELHNRMSFSTKDRDNDNRSGSSCSVNMKGGWWYNKCVRTNLNGVYRPGTKHDIESIYWDTWQLDVGLAAVEIKIKRC